MLVVNMKKMPLRWLKCCHVIPQARHASREEMTLLHDEELVLRLKETASMTTEEMKRLARNYDYIYFHPVRVTGLMG